jgi:DNA-binding transcriptional regulator YiaG
MKSPLTGKPMPLIRQLQTESFRKESFEIYQHYYVCVDSGGHYSTAALKELNKLQVQNKYRERYCLPFRDEIAGIRHRYGLSASRMAEVLGFGVNVYRNYESGEVPSISNARLIQVCKSPANFLSLYRMNGGPRKHEEKKLMKRIDNFREQQAQPSFQMTQNLLLQESPGLFNGYVFPEFGFIAYLLSQFVRTGPVKMKWLPLLIFLADFSHYRKHGLGLSGLFYKVRKEVINMPCLPGLVHLTTEMGCCEISFGPDGQTYIGSGDKLPQAPEGIPWLEHYNLQAMAEKVLNFQRQQEFAEITSEILGYPVIKKAAMDEAFIPYDAAFELNCLDEWNPWE